MQYLKALYGAVVAGFAAALSYASGGGSATWAVLYGVSAALAAFGVVWAVPNRPARPKGPSRP